MWQSFASINMWTPIQLQENLHLCSARW